MTFLLTCSGCEDRERNDAQLFLDRIQAIDIDAPLRDRRPRIEALAGIAVTSESVVHARDVCVDAHRALYQAEEQLNAARQALERLEQEQAEASDEARTALGASLETGVHAIEQARPKFERCEHERTTLSTRFGGAGGGTAAP